jgi:double zinc ribbon protein
MQCPKCRFDNPEDSKFCNECGGRLELACPNCRKVNPPGSKFCNGCGGSLRPSKSASGLDYPLPQSYIPKFLANIECGIDERTSDEIESLYGQAMDLAEELGMRPLVAHCHRGLGVLYGRDGKKDRGREQFAKPIDTLLQCGADGWVEKYEKSCRLFHRDST